MVSHDSAKALSDLAHPVAPRPQPAGVTASQTVSEKVAPAAVPDYNTDRRTRPRPPVSDIFFARSSGEKHFALLVYYPIAGGAIIVLLSALFFVRGWRTDDPNFIRKGFILLVATGAALTLLPQYFLFRPDPPHVSEMMCAFVIAAAIAFDAGLVARRTGGPMGPMLRFIGTSYMVLAVIHIAFYIEYGMRRPSMGSYAIKSRSEVFFKADNGV